jgi:hypothetical protein
MVSLALGLQNIPNAYMVTIIIEKLDNRERIQTVLSVLNEKIKK